MSFFRDTWIVFTRAMRLALRQPLWVIIGLTQPILYLTLFGPLLVSMAQAPGFPPGDAWQIFVPGLLIQMGIFGGLFVGFGIIAEWRSGVIDRMLVTPASRASLVAGRALRDVIVIMVQGAVLIGCAFFMGLRVPVGAVVVGLILIGILAGAFSCISNAIGLATKSEDALAPLVNSLALPILLLSGILLPMTLAPRWLQVLSDINPFKHIVDAMRAVFQGELTTPVVVLGAVLTVLLAVIGGWVGARAVAGQTK